MLSGHIARRRCGAGHLHHNRIGQVFRAPLSALRKPLRMGTNDADILNRRAWYPHQRLADREHHFAHHIDAVRRNQRIHILYHRTAKRVLLWDYGIR